jgi:hypothetical protein
MKYVLIAFLIKDLVVSPPWATSAVAEFNSLEACRAAAQRLQPVANRLNAKLEWGCVEKGPDQPKKEGTG